MMAVRLKIFKADFIVNLLDRMRMIEFKGFRIKVLSWRWMLFKTFFHFCESILIPIAIDDSILYSYIGYKISYENKCMDIDLLLVKKKLILDILLNHKASIIFCMHHYKFFDLLKVWEDLRYLNAWLLSIFYDPLSFILSSQQIIF